MYETTLIKEGECPVCGHSFGYELEINTNRAVNQYSNCMCSLEQEDEDSVLDRFADMYETRELYDRYFRAVYGIYP